MKSTRRDILKSLLFGSSSVGLLSVASGIPLSALIAGIPTEEALADEAAKKEGNFLILNTSGVGDPFNANAPGCYDTGLAGIHNNPNPELAPTALRLGSVSTRAAKPFGQLPQWALDQSVFIHHRTYQNAHPQYGKVMGLVGSAKGPEGTGSDQLASIIAAAMAQTLDTLQPEPVSLGGGNLKFQGRTLQRLNPQTLGSMFAPAENEQLELQKLRDATLDKLNKQLREQTGTTKYQKKWLDRHANSRTQVRKIDETLLSRLGGIQGRGARDQVEAAIILILMKVSPVISLHIPFGRDNHADKGLIDERDEMISGMATMKEMFENLDAAGLRDRVTVANFNVFGRTLRFQDNKGRDHNLMHHVMMISGAKVKPGVVGKIVPIGKDFGATGFDSVTGRGNEDKSAVDIQPEETLEATAKTLAKAVGVSDDVIEKRIKGGKVIRAALA